MAILSKNIVNFRCIVRKVQKMDEWAPMPVAYGLICKKFQIRDHIRNLRLRLPLRKKYWARLILNLEIFNHSKSYLFLINYKYLNKIRFELWSIKKNISATAYRCSRCWKNMFLTSSEPYVAFCRLDIARYYFFKSEKFLVYYLKHI